MKTQIEKFQKGTSFVNIVAPVTVNELTDIKSVDDAYTELECIKFIPSSGAATRMFKDLYTYLETSSDMACIEDFFECIDQFPFYRDLHTLIGEQTFDKTTTEGRKLIIDTLLNAGLNYGSLPKALLKFHRYETSLLTPIDEHIYEGEHYLSNDQVHLHFTISKEHESLFKDYVKQATQGKDNIKISHSFQKKATDTLAVDMDNQPFKLDDGEILYRAGGHGSLIENLNDLDGDIIFIKNIDNVCHQSKVQDTIDSKKKLAAIGYEVKGRIENYIKGIRADNYDLVAIKEFLSETLNINMKKTLTKEVALELLDRPLRVCGMVKNEGEPGGGPFVVDNGDYLDLQICESVEIDLMDSKCKEIVAGANYFNPVDLVCFVKNYQGAKYNLLDYVNQDRYFISEKSYKGRKLKALEHPGLWNGAMHNWNTLFVEVPLSTFNPVKTVNNLLRDGHVDQLVLNK